MKQRRENTKGRSVWNRAVALVVMFAMVITLFPFVPGVQPQAQAATIVNGNKAKIVSASSKIIEVHAEVMSDVRTPI